MAIPVLMIIAISSFSMLLQYCNIVGGVGRGVQSRYCNIVNSMLHVYTRVLPVVGMVCVLNIAMDAGSARAPPVCMMSVCLYLLSSTEYTCTYPGNTCTLEYRYSSTGTGTREYRYCNMWLYFFNNMAILDKIGQRMGTYIAIYEYMCPCADLFCPVWPYC